MEASGESEDHAVLAALRAGDEAAFLALVGRHQASMIHVALGHVPSRAVAEEVVQEAWLGVLAGLGGFEGRSSLKSWIFRIVVNCAKTRGKRERRSVPLSSLGTPDDQAERAVDPDRFLGDGHRWAGHWVSLPERWADDQLASAEAVRVVEQAIAALPDEQRMVITMRDVEGLRADEVCEILGLSEANQRVLLHRARCKVRRAVEEHLRDGEVAA